MTSSPISKSIVTNSQAKKVLEALKNGLLEKDETVALSLLAAISGESIFLLGQPGVAKSMIARRLKSAFKDATAFEYLMNRFSTPEDIFGPIDIQELKKGNHQRKAEGYLPTASIAFLDEIWKAGPAIQNTLLTVINERIFRNGTTEEKVPLKTLIAASNELPAPNEGLEALWDRFLIRLEVKGIESTDNFDALLTKPIEPIKVEEKDKISDEQYTATQDAIANITLPENILAIIHSIRNAIIIYNEQHTDAPIYISDRRWLKIARILRTSALLHNRKEVDLMDCFLMAYCLWSNDEQRVYLLSKISDLLREKGYTATLNLEEIEEVLTIVKEDIEQETRQQAIVEDDRPICEDDQYTFNYRNVEYKIEVSDYNTLDASPKEVSVECQDPWGGSRNKELSIAKKNNAYLLVDNTEVALETKLQEVNYWVGRRPHKQLVESWDKQVVTLIKACEEKESELVVFEKKNLSPMRAHLFVPSEKAELIAQNLKDMKLQVEKLKTRIKELKDYYQNIAEGQKIAPVEAL